MLSLKEFKLTNLANHAISRKNQGYIKGGLNDSGNCGCGCRYADSGGSSTCDNSSANYDGGLTSGPGSSSCGVNASKNEQMFFACVG